MENSDNWKREILKNRKIVKRNWKYWIMESTENWKILKNRTTLNNWKILKNGKGTLQTFLSSRFLGNIHTSPIRWDPHTLRSKSFTFPLVSYFFPSRYSILQPCRWFHISVQNLSYFCGTALSSKFWREEKAITQLCVKNTAGTWSGGREHLLFWNLCISMFNIYGAVIHEMECKVRSLNSKAL